MVRASMAQPRVILADPGVQVGQEPVEGRCATCRERRPANGNWTDQHCDCEDEPDIEATCHRCGGANVVWSAPSPLWNAVMRGGSISGQDECDGIVCPTCFAQLAEAEDLAQRWRFYPESVTPDLETVTPDGRVWDDEAWLWVAPPREPRTWPKLDPAPEIADLPDVVAVMREDGDAWHWKRRTDAGFQTRYSRPGQIARTLSELRELGEVREVLT